MSRRTEASREQSPLRGVELVDIDDRQEVEAADMPRDAASTLGRNDLEERIRELVRDCEKATAANQRLKEELEHFKRRFTLHLIDEANAALLEEGLLETLSDSPTESDWMALPSEPQRLEGLTIAPGRRLPLEGRDYGRVLDSHDLKETSGKSAHECWWSIEPNTDHVMLSVLARYLGRRFIKIQAALEGHTVSARIDLFSASSSIVEREGGPLTLITSDVCRFVAGWFLVNVVFQVPPGRPLEVGVGARSGTDGQWSFGGRMRSWLLDLDRPGQVCLRQAPSRRRCVPVDRPRSAPAGAWPCALVLVDARAPGGRCPGVRPTQPTHAGDGSVRGVRPRRPGPCASAVSTGRIHDRPQSRRAGRVHPAGGGHRHRRRHLHRQHRRHRHPLHLPDQSDQPIRNKPALLLVPHRHPRRERRNHGQRCRVDAQHLSAGRADPERAVPDRNCERCGNFGR